MTTATASRRPGISISAVIVLVAVIAVVVLLLAGQSPWSVLFIDPLLNALVFLNIFTFGNFGLAIIAFTVILRIVTLPFTIRQFQSTRAMQAIQPEVQEIQKKYKDPKRRQEEMMRLYKENHVNPLGCLWPTLIQFGVFFALYRALVFTVGGSPESLVGLSQRLYPLDILRAQIPLNQHFLWLNLGQPDPTYILPVMVGISTYVQQRLSVTPNASPQQQQQQQMMTWMLPMMLTFFMLSLPSGVGIYWVVSNLFSLFAAYWVYGRRFLSWRQLLPIPMEEAPAPAARPKDKAETADRADIVVEATEVDQNAPAIEGQKEARTNHDGKRRGKRKKRR